MEHPKGKLIAIGGAEHKGTDTESNDLLRLNRNFVELAILRRIVEETGGRNAHIEVITTASMIPNEVGNNYLDAFAELAAPMWEYYLSVPGKMHSILNISGE